MPARLSSALRETWSLCVVEMRPQSAGERTVRNTAAHDGRLSCCCSCSLAVPVSSTSSLVQLVALQTRRPSLPSAAASNQGSPANGDAAVGLSLETHLPPARYRREHSFSLCLKRRDITPMCSARCALLGVLQALPGAQSMMRSAAALRSVRDVHVQA